VSHTHLYYGTNVGPRTCLYGTRTSLSLNRACHHDVSLRNQISVLFAVTWGPSYIYLFLINANKVTFDAFFNYALLGIAYLYNCINPFIYAVNFDPVKCVLLRLLPCKKTTQPVDISL